MLRPGDAASLADWPELTTWPHRPLGPGRASSWWARAARDYPGCGAEEARERDLRALGGDHLGQGDPPHPNLSLTHTLEARQCEFLSSAVTNDRKLGGSKTFITHSCGSAGFSALGLRRPQEGVGGLGSLHEALGRTHFHVHLSLEQV